MTSSAVKLQNEIQEKATYVFFICLFVCLFTYLKQVLLGYLAGPELLGLQAPLPLAFIRDCDTGTYHCIELRELS